MLIRIRCRNSWLTDSTLTMTYLPEFLSWLNLAAFFNSAFATSLAGAYAGAKAAQKIAERIKERSEIQIQIRNTNAAITIAFIICNAAISLKNNRPKSSAIRISKKRQPWLSSFESGTQEKFQETLHISSRPISGACHSPPFQLTHYVLSSMKSFLFQADR